MDQAHGVGRKALEHGAQLRLEGLGQIRAHIEASVGARLSDLHETECRSVEARRGQFHSSNGSRLSGGGRPRRRQRPLQLIEELAAPGSSNPGDLDLGRPLGFEETQGLCPGFFQVKWGHGWFLRGGTRETVSPVDRRPVELASALPSSSS